MSLLRVSRATRGISHAAVCRASVSDAKVNSSTVASAVASSSSTSSSSSSSEPDRLPLEKPAHLSKEAFAKRREEKLQKYAEALQETAKKQGFSSVEDLIEKQKTLRRAQQPKNGAEIASSKTAGLTEQDSKVAQEILRRVEAEAQRKHQTGDFTSGPGGMKSLSDIIDMERVQADDPQTIAQLWTQYHTLKNKLSAVIPAGQYADMVEKARRFPQFIIPLPRTIVGSYDANKTANVAPGERKSGYEMQYMEWGFLPIPSATKHTTTEGTVFSAPPSTVLFTPLAEYKLRQEYAQPVLVLTHYTDLADSKGIVLLRGEVTEVSDGQQPPPTGIAAAVAASQRAGGAEKNATAASKERLHAPLQTQGPITAQDAQLLTVTLQRFYLPKAAGVGVQPGEKEREDLLEAFHGDQDRFDIDKLCKCAFEM